MMRCFLPCFRASKRSKHLGSVNATPTQGHQTHVADGASSQLTQQKTVAQSEFEEQSNGSARVTPNKELIERLEEQEKAAAREEDTPQIGEKKDKHGEHDDAGNDNGLLQEEEECSESLFSLSIESRKQVSAADKAEAEVNSPMQLCGAAKDECNQIQGKISKGTGVESPTKEAKEGTEVSIVKPEEQQHGIAVMKANTNEEESSANKLVENNEEKGKARSPKHTEYRYRDCSYEGYEDMNLNGSNLDVSLEEEGSDVNGTWVQEYSSESLFSLSTDSRRPTSAAEKEDNEVDSSHVTEEETQGRIPVVLNPIENVVTQEGRVDKATLLKPLKMKEKNDKENINNSVVVVQDMPLSPEHSVKLSKRKARQKMNNKEQEEIIGVDTSLSSWLEAGTPISMKSNSSVGEEQTPKGGGRGSPWSNEDRPILGALTVEEIRMYSVTSTSSRRSRTKSPDETPIIGTVGSYWTHTGQIIESNSSKTEKDAKLESSSSTVKTRLERAFEASVCEV